MKFRMSSSISLSYWIELSYAFTFGSGSVRSLLPLIAVPDVAQNIRHVLIDKTVVRGEKPPLYWSKGEGATFWTAWTEAEAHEEQST